MYEASNVMADDHPPSDHDDASNHDSDKDNDDNNDDNNAPKLDPIAVTAIGFGAAGALLVAAPVLVVAPVVGVLNLVGFGAGGIVAGSAAAASQAAIGNVAAGSLFATLTSARAGGFGVAPITGAVQAVRVGAAAAATGFGAMINRENRR